MKIKAASQCVCAGRLRDDDLRPIALDDDHELLVLGLGHPRRLNVAAISLATASRSAAFGVHRHVGEESIHHASTALAMPYVSPNRSYRDASLISLPLSVSGPHTRT
jgi:hypothetical protein